MTNHIGVVVGAILLAVPASLLALQGRAGPPTQSQSAPPPPSIPGGIPGRGGQTTGQGRGTTPATAQDPQQTPVFRAGTVLVPVDVRAFDRATGKPVTDLRQDEFVVVESGVRQRVQFFSTQSLIADESVTASPLVRATPVSSTLGPQTRRTFLIVLGRGRLQPVTKAVDGMLHLIKERLLPQDYVAVMAFNRATEFTTDHVKIAGVLERYLKQHEKVEALMAQYFSGLTAQYGGSYIPKAIQSQVDAIFQGPDAPGLRTVPTSPVTNGARLANDQRLTADALQQKEINATRDPGTFLTDPVDVASGIEMSFDDYVTANAQTNQDLAKIYAGISYLRYLDGEKHLVFISERGLFLPRAEDDKGLAAQAADARVAIDIMHTGGTAPVMMGGGAARGGGPVGGRVTMSPSGPMAGDWRVQTSQTVAQQTGGEFTSFLSGKAFVDRLDDRTRFLYLLGYTPTNTTWDGAFRKVNVTTTRRGVVLEFRHGYYAQQELTPLDKPRALAYTRVVSAANTPDAIPDIGLDVTVTNTAGDDGTPAVDLVVKIKPDQLGFSDKDGKKTGKIEVAIFCADDKEHLLGESWNTVELTMTPDAFAKFQASGLRYSARIPVKGAPRFVKVIVYDPAHDVLGSSLTKLEVPRVKK